MHTLLLYAIALSQLRAEELGAAEAPDAVGVSNIFGMAQHHAAPAFARVFFCFFKLSTIVYHNFCQLKLLQASKVKA